MLNAEDIKYEQFSLEKIFELALRNDSFYMCYQPIVSTNNSRLIGFEALIRSRINDVRLRPDNLIPYVEKTGQIIELGSWILKQCLVDYKRLESYGLKDFTMSINISPIQIIDHDVTVEINDLINELGVCPKNIKLELTETALISDSNKISNTFARLREMGIKIWLDDFGTGFASLSLLRQFKVNGIKIDKSFVSNIATDNDDFTLCSAIIAMAQRLNLELIAEGIETPQQLQILNCLGCENIQGYLIDKPLALGDVITKWAK
ncbi:EAL domain-containing protein [Pseudoalteromonas sp.]|uniref:EAL domain-containing protein n=1 Tax=Pseudoalteromonas sp. TaxID=53249 RepID=UPI001BCECCCC|nr:EAL domain-containing protein [Pseudoalteromonas sp.]